MATKEKILLDHSDLAHSLEILRAMRKAKAAVETHEKEASDNSKELLEEIGLGSFEVPVEGGTLSFSFIEGTRTSLSKDLLLEAGVKPEVLEKCTKSSSYRYIGPIKHEPLV